MATEKIFFSYSRFDSAFALKLAKDLREAGINLWLDQLSIPAGSRWDNEIQTALPTADCVLAILSPTSIESENVMDEISYALEQKKRVIPIMLIDIMETPFRLKRLQRIDFTTNYNQGLKELLATLNVQKPESANKNLKTKSEFSNNSRNNLTRYLTYLFIGLCILAASLAIWDSLLDEKRKNNFTPSNTSSSKTDTNTQKEQAGELTTEYKQKADYPNKRKSLSGNTYNIVKPHNKAEYVQIKLIVAASFSKAQIFVDDKAAKIIDNTLTVKTIEVENNKNHSFRLVEDDKNCNFSSFISQSGQQIVASCN